jgi:GNAT superfamily N-acetyltransferase
LIRDTVRSDSPAILELMRSSGQFDADGISHVAGTLDQHLSTPTGHVWLTADDGEPVGVAYCAPEPVAPGVWNLLMLWIRADRHGAGIGAALVTAVEARVRADGARLLIVETSSLPDFEPARRLYSKCGFEREPAVRDYFGEGDDKIIFTKKLAPRTTSAAVGFEHPRA